MRQKHLVVLAAWFLIFGTIGLAQQKGASFQEDQALRTKIVDRLTLDHWLQGVMPQVSVENGVAKLSGKLTSEVYRKRILKVVRETAGVKGVVDQMEVLKAK